VKYSSTTALIPEVVADLIKDPEVEEKLLGEILKHRGEKRFVTNVGGKELTLSTVPPNVDPASLELCE
jgi:hypothetical protein